MTPDNEKRQYVEWIKELMSERIDELSLEQLKILHFVLGYNLSFLSKEEFVDYSDGLNMDESNAGSMWNVLREQGIMLMKEAYPIE